MTDGKEDLLYQCELAATRCIMCGKFGHRAPECKENRRELDRLMQKESPMIGREMIRVVVVHVTPFVFGLMIALTSFLIGLAVAKWCLR